MKARGVSGDNKPVYVGYVHGVKTWLRNRVCYLDGIEIDGHELSDITHDSHCMHCGEEPDWDD